MAAGLDAGSAPSVGERDVGPTVGPGGVVRGHGIDVDCGRGPMAGGAWGAGTEASLVTGVGDQFYCSFFQFLPAWFHGGGSDEGLLRGPRNPA